MKNLTTILLSCLLATLFVGVSFGDDDKEEGDHSKEVNKEVSVNVWVEDGKLTIDTGDGKKEIELSELHGGGELSDALKGISLGGEGKATIKAKVMIIDDQGEPRVINLGDGEAHDIDVLMLHEGHHDDDHDDHKGHTEKTVRKIKKRMRLPGGGKIELRFEGDGKHFSIPELGEHFMWMHRDDDDVHAEMFRGSDYIIGVELMPLGPMLRSHLALDEHEGIGVRTVIDGTPAQEAGLEQHDIIVSVDGETLDRYEALVEAVASAGEQESAVTLGIIRAGERREVDVTPMKRKTEIRKEIIVERGDEGEDGMSEGEEEDEGEDDEDDDDEDDDDEDDSIDEIKDELQALKEALRALREQLHEKE